MSSKKHSYAEISQSLNLWRTYVDIDGLDSEEAFNNTSWEERLYLMIDMYGPEESDSLIEL